MFTIWFVVILNVLIAPIISLSGKGGEKLVMESGFDLDVSVKNLVSV